MYIRQSHKSEQINILDNNKKQKCWLQQIQFICDYRFACTAFFYLSSKQQKFFLNIVSLGKNVTDNIVS